MLPNRTSVAPAAEGENSNFRGTGQLMSRSKNMNTSLLKTVPIRMPPTAVAQKAYRFSHSSIRAMWRFSMPRML